MTMTMTTTTMMIKCQAFHRNFEIPTRIKNPTLNNNVSKWNNILNLSNKQKHKHTDLVARQAADQTPAPAPSPSKVGVGVAVAVAVAVMVGFGNDKAWALGPEGPLMEEFWENVRRYALYALTVSTGVLYTVLQPIVELLKNPISALLIILIIGGSFFIVSQILSAMVGVSNFDYQYSY